MRDYLFVARRWLPLLAALTLLGGIVGLGMGLAAGGSAQSQARIFVRNGEADNVPAAQSTLGIQRMASYADLVTSTRLAQLVVNDTHIDRDPAELAEAFTTELAPDSQVMTVTVTADTSQEADAVLRSLPTQMTRLLAELGGASAQGRMAPSFTIVDGPTGGSGRSLKTMLASTLVGLVLGSLAGALVVAARTRANPALRSPETVAERAGIAVAGALPRSEESAERRPAYHRLAQRVQGRLPERGVVAVTSATPGVAEGVARGLADAFTERGRRTAFVTVAEDGTGTLLGGDAVTGAGAPHEWGHVHAWVEGLRAHHDVTVLQLPRVEDAAVAGAWFDEADACLLAVDQGRDKERTVVRAASDLRSYVRADTALVSVGGTEKV